MPDARYTASICLGLVFLMVVFAAGCTRRPVSPPSQERSSYYQTLDEWTRSTKVFEGFESRLYIYATYKSMDFRKAYIDEYAERYQLEDDYKNALLERESLLNQKYNEFFISAFTPVDEWNDFDKRGSIWRLYLSDNNGLRVEPLEIRKVDSKDPVYGEFFPFLDPWSRGYLVRFPRYDYKGRGPIGEEKSEYLKLTVTGIKGRGELVWSLKPDRQAGGIKGGPDPVDGVLKKGHGDAP